MQDQQNSRWSARPTRTGIRQASTPTSYEKGLSYYTTGRIQSAYIKEDLLKAVVMDGVKHHVDVKDAGVEGLIGDCTCSYNSQHYGICRHIVAVLMHLLDHIDDMLVAEDTREATIKYMIEKTPTDNILKFLTVVMMDDEELRQKFIKEFNLEHIRLQRDYRAEIDRMYRDAVEADGKVYSNLDFEGYFTNARESQHGDEVDSATRMFRDMSEIISEHMVMVDDSDNYYTDCFIEALENMAESVVREGLTPEKKRDHIKYLLKKFVRETRTKFVSQYRVALETICTHNNDLLYWKTQLDVHLKSMAGPDKIPANAVDLVLMQSYILEQLADSDGLISLLAEFYHMDKKVCKKYLEAIKQTTPTKARRAAQAVVEKYPDDMDILEIAFEFYSKSSRGYTLLLKRMFVMTGDWKYYFKIKDTAKNWNAVMTSLVDECIESHPQMAAEIYIKENMMYEAMGLLESLGNLDLFELFRTRLARRYPSRYLTAYGSSIIETLRTKTGKKHYEKIQRCLISLRAIPGAEAKYAGIINSIRVEHPTKRALLKMLDEIE